MGMVGAWCARTIVKPCETYLEAQKGRDSMLCLQRSHVEVVIPLEPDLAHSLEPRGCQHLHIFSFLRDIAIFCAVNVAHNEMRYVGGQIELDGGAQVSADVPECGLAAN